MMQSLVGFYFESSLNYTLEKEVGEIQRKLEESDTIIMSAISPLGRQCTSHLSPGADPRFLN